MTEREWLDALLAKAPPVKPEALARISFLLPPATHPAPSGPGGPTGPTPTGPSTPGAPPREVAA